MKIAEKIVGNIGYNRAELTWADLTRGRVDPLSNVGPYMLIRKGHGAGEKGHGTGPC